MGSKMNEAHGVIKSLKHCINTILQYSRDDAGIKELLGFYQFTIRIIENVIKSERTYSSDSGTKHPTTKVMSWVNSFFDTFKMPYLIIYDDHTHSYLWMYCNNNCVGKTPTKLKMRDIFDGPNVVAFSVGRNSCVERIFGTTCPFVGLFDIYLDLAIFLDQTRTDNDHMEDFFRDYIDRFTLLDKIMSKDGCYTIEAKHGSEEESRVEKIIRWINDYAETKGMNGKFMTMSDGKCQLDIIWRFTAEQNSEKQGVLLFTKSEVDKMISDRSEKRTKDAINSIKEKITKKTIEEAIDLGFNESLSKEICFGESIGIDFFSSAVDKFNKEIIDLSGSEAPYLLKFFQHDGKNYVRILINHQLFDRSEISGVVGKLTK